jgi:hypothetical protein
MSLGLGPLGTHALGLPANTSTAAPESSPAPLPQLALLGGATAIGMSGTAGTTSSASPATLTITYGDAMPMPLPQLALLGGATATGGTSLQAAPAAIATSAAPAALTLRVPLAGTGATAVTNTGSVFKDYGYPAPLPQLALLGGASEVGVSFVNTELTGAGIDPLWLRARAAALHDDGAVLAGSGTTRTSGYSTLIRPVPLEATPYVTSWAAAPASLVVSTLITSPETATAWVAEPALLVTYRLIAGTSSVSAHAAAASLTVSATLAGSASSASSGSAMLNGAALYGTGTTPARGQGDFTPGAPFQQIAGTGATSVSGQAELDLGLPRVVLVASASTATSGSAELTPGAQSVQLAGTGETRVQPATVSLAVRVALQAIAAAQTSARGTLSGQVAPPPPPDLEYTRAPLGSGFNATSVGPKPTSTRLRVRTTRFTR